MRLPGTSCRRHGSEPADRFIATTSISHDAPLATKDKLMRDLGWLHTVWSVEILLDASCTNTCPRVRIIRMALTKLTLSMEPGLVEAAKRLAAERGSSLSAMLSRLLRAMGAGRQADESAFAPLTRAVSGLVSLPEGPSDADLLADALAARHEQRG